MTMRILRILYWAVLSLLLCGMTVVWYYNNVNWQAPWFEQCIIWARLAGIWLFLLFMFQLLTMCRSRILNMAFTKLQLRRMHQFIGAGMMLFFVLHLGLMMPGKIVKHQLSVTEYIGNVLWNGDIAKLTSIGLLAFFAVWIFSLLMIKKAINVKFWQRTHYLTYPSIALLFIHQIKWGNDFQRSQMLMWFWVILFIFIFLDSIFWRFFSHYIFTQNGNRRH